MSNDFSKPPSRPSHKPFQKGKKQGGSKDKGKRGRGNQSSHGSQSSQGGQGNRGSRGGQVGRGRKERGGGSEEKGFTTDRDGKPEVKLYGVEACLAVYAERPDAIMRAYFSEQVAGKFGAMMKQLARARRPYRVIDDAELIKVSGTRHHEGAVVVIRPEPLREVGHFLGSLSEVGPVCVLGLEGVGNPHNLGAIARVAAQFGVTAIVSDNATGLQSGAAARTAQGGIEFVEPIFAPDPVMALDAFRRAGFTVFTTSSHRGDDVFSIDFPERSLVFFGEEGPGLSPEMIRNGDQLVNIPGTGHVESLNVACACAVVLGQVWACGEN